MAARLLPVQPSLLSTKRVSIPWLSRACGSLMSCTHNSVGARRRASAVPWRSASCGARARGEANATPPRYPAAAFVSPDGGANSASSGRLIAACRVGAVICAPVRSVT